MTPLIFLYVYSSILQTICNNYPKRIKEIGFHNKIKALIALINNNKFIFHNFMRIPFFVVLWISR